jgi:hypothetical protein
MAFLGKNTNLSIKLNGKGLTPPKEWEDLSVLATFDEEVQANISTEEFTFILESYQELKSHLSQGLNGTKGIFEGVPFNIEAVNKDGSISAFDGFVDMSQNVQVDDTNGEILARIKKSNGLNSLSDRLEAIDWGFLDEQGAVSSSDYVNVNYIVQPKDQTIDALVGAIIIYVMSKELYDSIIKLAKDGAIISGITSAASTGSVGAVIFAVLATIANVAYVAALFIVITQLATDFVFKYGSIKRTHKAIRLKRMLEIVSEFLGYDFNTSIDELEKIVYLPSNISTDSYDKKGFLKIPGTIKKGIPAILDYGYTGAQTFELARSLFNGRFAIVENTIQFHSENSSYWVKQSTWTKPNTLQVPYSYNTDQLSSNLLISFQTDISDIYTIDNFTGTNFEVITQPKQTKNDYNSIKGLERVDIPCALGNRKNSLTGFENLVLLVAKTIDTLTKSELFGKKTNYSKQVKSKIGGLLVSDNNHSIPKLLWMPGNSIPTNHREELSARALWDGFHNEKSFVLNNFKKQRRVVEGEEVPFGFEDFVQLINNSYFYENGKPGKVTRLEWNMSKDTAILDYWVEEVFTKNLKETYIEP